MEHEVMTLSATDSSEAVASGNNSKLFQLRFIRSLRCLRVQGGSLRRSKQIIELR